MKPIGLFGGTFDPIHIGHLITAQSVFELRRLQKIIFMPAYVSPLKIDYLSASSEDRTKMVELAIKDYPYFELSRYEIEKHKISYTIDTLKNLKKRYDKIELIIGYDNYLVFHKWRKVEEILELVKVIVLNRRVDKIEREGQDERFVFVDNPIIQITSTEIRNRVRQNMPIDFFVHPKVKEYIEKKNLYSGSR
ncbi:Nicotinate-nucleotide adenylyltransferase [hydrothermal vent metagenome]|uniref:Nicotinate-nucleotide adenylyltransferase n=1 Tax=hydrothermal vent metagenome TaxID=652676 RepID=A0A3B1CH80_9ZZZZ